jgi:hypothetical protein
VVSADGGTDTKCYKYQGWGPVPSVSFYGMGEDQRWSMATLSAV